MSLSVRGSAGLDIAVSLNGVTADEVVLLPTYRHCGLVSTPLLGGLVTIGNVNLRARRFSSGTEKKRSMPVTRYGRKHR